MIPSVAWAKDYQFKRIRFRHIYKDFLKVKVAELANKLIVDPVVEEMRREGVSRKIYENVQLMPVIINENGIFLRIHSEYFADNGFDVALAREEGTDNEKDDHKHWVRPREKSRLSWIQDGKRRSSYGHKVTGLPKLNIIQKIIERNSYELQQQLNDEFGKWKTNLFVSN